MSKLRRHHMLVALLIPVILGGSVAGADTLYYAMEQNGAISGYAQVSVSDTALGGREALLVVDEIVASVSLMGASIKGEYRFEYHVDPLTGRYFYHKSNIKQGTLNLNAEMTVVYDTVTIVSDSGGDTTIVPLPPGTILQNTLFFPHLLKDFAADVAGEREYQVFSEADGMINDVIYTGIGEDDLELAGNVYEAVGFTALNRTNGIKVEQWIDKENGYLLRQVHPLSNKYLTDASVKDRLEEANMDDRIFTKVGVVIPNTKGIAYMKVKADLQPAGIWLTPEALNIRGQAFEGAVEENHIVGVFEVAHERYDGSDAPPFPPNFGSEDTLASYLEPSDMIESDDSAILNEALQLTAGSTDSWEAVRRLSRWVCDEIAYGIPGGGTALNTYKIRQGECGAHSNLLAAFCRAVGIPARTVFGCMYVPNEGGAFGQHAWNEIYMGDAGWIPVDATVEEIDYVDCGHIRLGEVKSRTAMLNAANMEIIDYRVEEEASSDKSRLHHERYQKYVGEYQGESKVLTVLIQNESLALDIPGKMVFELRDSDENGAWFFKLTDRVSVTFTEDESGEVIMMTINSRQRFPRQVEQGAPGLDDDIPVEYRRYVGTYTVPMQNQVFTVVYQDDGLAVDIPGDQVRPLERQGDEEGWLCRLNSVIQLGLSFDLGEDDVARSLILSEIVRCPRLESGGDE